MKQVPNRSEAGKMKRKLMVLAVRIVMLLPVERNTRAFIVGLGLLALVCYAPGVAAQPSWAITNPGTCLEKVDYTVTGEYKCVVEWYVEVPTDATVLVSLIDMERGGVVIDSEKYSVHSGRSDGFTNLTRDLPRFHTLMRLRVELEVQGDMWMDGPEPEYYDLNVEVVPEFPVPALVLLASLILAVIARTGLERRAKGAPANVPYS